jgi:cyclase
MDMRVIPALLLAHRKLVKTVGFESPRYVGDPVNTISILSAYQVDEIMISDISASKNRLAPDFEYLSQLTRESFVPLAYGGNVRSIEDAARLIEMGFEKLIFGSALFEDPDLIAEVVDAFGSQAVIASLDFFTLNGERKIYMHGGKTPVNGSLDSCLQLVSQLNVGELMVTNINREG